MENTPFIGKPEAERIYAALLKRLRPLGAYSEEMKKSSVHIVAGKGAFLGVHPRAGGLLVNLVLTRALDAPRVVKVEQVSRFRYHNEVRLASEADLDDQLLEWIREAYEIKAG